ncbi:MAG: hypothetical protein RJB38_844 [Pseudomonadota bacterium]|jgi:hypothetical protein
MGALTLFQHPARAESSTPNATSESESPSTPSAWSARYFGIYFFPPFRGSSDRSTIDTRNYLSLLSRIDSDTTVGLTAGWNLQTSAAQPFTARDPFFKLGRANIIHEGAFSWYGDLRVHFPITSESRSRDLWVGLQTFHYLSWEPGRGGVALALSSRFNQFGGEGQGDAWEWYSAPSVFWSLSEKLALNALIEWGGGMPFGETSRTLFSNGLDLEPGVNWQLNPVLWINPYLTIPLDQTSRDLLGGPSLGMTLSWQLL